MNSTRNILFTLLGICIGFVVGIFIFAFALYMHVEDLLMETNPELIATVAAVPPQVKPLFIAAAIGVLICSVLLISSFARNKRKDS